MKATLAEIVRVGRRFTRAIRVDTDLRDPTALEGYVCSQSAIETLLLMARHREATGHGAFTWTGPYGSGKSSLAVALAALTGGADGARTSLLHHISASDRAELLAAFRPSKKPWLVVAAVGRREEPEQVLSEALTSAVAAIPELARMPNEYLPVWAARIAESQRYAGVLFLIDEMGKFLENAARSGGDIHLFQDIAESSSRADGRLVIVAILHQAFDEYAHRLAREARDEWIKVQGRFLDISINLAVEEQLDLIGRAIESSEKPTHISAAVSTVARTLRNYRHGDVSILENQLSACWPLHPIVAALLGPISRRRFGQNQRSLFGFLNSAEPFGFQAFLKETPRSAVDLFPVGRLWDYLHANLEPSILASPDGHRWSIALEAVGRAETRSSSLEHIELLKAVALVDLFKDRSGLQATPDVLSQVLPAISFARVETLLSDLKAWSVVIYRRHAGNYAIYAGSDFDIEGAVDQARQAGIELDYRQLARYASLQPILAKRHYEVTGALRWFEIELAPLHDIEDRVANYRPAPGAAGLFLLAMSAQNETRAEAKKLLTKISTLAGERLIVVGWARDSFMIREMASDLAAFEHVRSHQPELEGDAIARREIDARIGRLSADLEDRLSDAINDVDWILPVGSDPSVAAGLTGPAGLSVLASRLADWRYPDAPLLPNELVNRNRPSSNAAAATRALLRAMVDKGTEPRLAFQGYPPEAGLYIGLLESTGLHRYDPEAMAWRFEAPEFDNPHHLYPLWQEADRALDANLEGLRVSELFDRWRQPRFGVRNGLLPILVVAYLLTRTRRSAIYLDGTFRPILDSFLVDRMLQEPACIRVRKVELSDVDVVLISALASHLSRRVGLISPTPLDVARALVKEVRELPAWTLRTTRLSQAAVQFRDKVKTADDPNQLLKHDLLEAFGITAQEVTGGVLAQHVIAALDELRNAYSVMLGQLESSLLKELRVKDGGDSLSMLRDRAICVKGLTGNFRLDALANRLLTYSGNLDEIEGLTSLAANKPPRDWVDRDVDAAAVELAALAQQFLKAEGLAHLKGRKDGRISMAIYISDPRYPEPRAREVELSAEDHHSAEAFAARIADLVRANGVSYEIALAALASLGLSLSNDDEMAGTPSLIAGSLS